MSTQALRQTITSYDCVFNGCSLS